MMPFGVSLKFARTRSEIFCSSTFAVPKVSIRTLTGSATPMAYANCTSQRSAKPAATMFLAM